MRGLATALAALALLGCGGGSGGSAAPGADVGGGGADAQGPIALQGGDYQLHVVKVDDGCLDGSLQLVFMPGGSAEPYALQNRTYIPSKDELPKTYEMQLQEPFDAMTITVVDGGLNRMQVTDGKQLGVALGLPGAGDCTADMDFTADIAIMGERAIELATTVVLSNFQSPRQLCPALQEVPCTVELEMTGALP